MGRRGVPVAVLAALAVAAVAAAGAGAGGGEAVPDGEVKVKGGEFFGLGIINNSGDGQTAKAKVKRGNRTSFTFRYKNVGGATSDFEIGGCSAEGLEVEVTYKSAGLDVTDNVNNGLYTFLDVIPGATTPDVKAKVFVPSDTPRGTIVDVCVPAVAQEPPNNRDEPEWRVRVR